MYREEKPDFKPPPHLALITLRKHWLNGLRCAPMHPAFLNSCSSLEEDTFFFFIRNVFLQLRHPLSVYSLAQCVKKYINKHMHLPARKTQVCVEQWRSVFLKCTVYIKCRPSLWAPIISWQSANIALIWLMWGKAFVRLQSNVRKCWGKRSVYLSVRETGLVSSKW